VKDAIRDNLCALLEAHPSSINLKAKTHEKVDSLGENRSIACHTVVLLVKSEPAEYGNSNTAARMFGTL
jgi:2-C-methyl-D-erythritol 2,4-cyclodiphosphate synthase